MTDWTEHNGGPQPVADDVWVELQWLFPEEDSVSDGVEAASEIPWEEKFRFRIINQHLIDAARLEGLQKGLKAFDEARLAVEGDIQKLCDAARLEGIRLGLEAAVKAADAYDDLAAMSVKRLDPETIAREATDKETAR